MAGVHRCSRRGMLLSKSSVFHRLRARSRSQTYGVEALHLRDAGVSRIAASMNMLVTALAI
jgi:hypothetical protein